MRYFILLFFFGAFTIQAQNKGLINDQMLWGGYYNSISFNTKLSLNSDLQERTKDWYKQWSQVLVRTGLNYKINDRLSVTAGLADFLFFGKNNLPERNEKRIWEEISFTQAFPKLKFNNRLRTEQRFFKNIENGKESGAVTEFYRFRYKIELQIPMKEKLTLVGGNEFMLNTKPDFVLFFFDQNRVYAGINTKLNDKLMLQLQLMLVQQKTTNNSPINQTFVIRLNLYHTIKLKHKDDSSAK